MEPLDITTTTSDSVASLTLPSTTLPIAQPSPSLPLQLTPTWETLQVRTDKSLYILLEKAQ